MRSILLVLYSKTVQIGIESTGQSPTLGIFGTAQLQLQLWLVQELLMWLWPWLVQELQLPLG